MQSERVDTSERTPEPKVKTRTVGLER